MYSYCLFKWRGALKCPFPTWEVSTYINSVARIHKQKLFDTLKSIAYNNEIIIVLLVRMIVKMLFVQDISNTIHGCFPEAGSHKVKQVPDANTRLVFQLLSSNSAENDTPFVLVTECSVCSFTALSVYLPFLVLLVKVLVCTSEERGLYCPFEEVGEILHSRPVL